MQKRRLSILAQAALVLSVTYTLIDAVKAADWEFVPDLTVGVHYTDNFFFTLNEKVSDTNLLIIPAVGLRGESEKNRATLQAGVRVERYKRIEDADRIDPFAYFGWEHFWEHHTLGINLGYWEESTRTSELETTGRTDVFGTRTNSNLTPQWQSIIDENNTLELRGELLDVSYDLPTFIDYQNYRLSLEWRHEKGPLHTIYFIPTGNVYNAEAIGLDYNYGEILTGMLYQQNEHVRYDLSLGIGYADRELQEDYITWLANVSITSEREYNETILSLSTDLAPTSSAELRKVYAIDFQYRREMSPGTDFTFATRFTRSQPVRGPGEDRNDNLTIQPGLSYQLVEEWFLETWYRYLRNRNFGSEYTKENSLYFGIRYEMLE